MHLLLSIFLCYPDVGLYLFVAHVQTLPPFFWLWLIVTSSPFLSCTLFWLCFQCKWVCCTLCALVAVFAHAMTCPPCYSLVTKSDRHCKYLYYIFKLVPQATSYTCNLVTVSVSSFHSDLELLSSWMLIVWHPCWITCHAVCVLVAVLVFLKPVKTRCCVCCSTVTSCDVVRCPYLLYCIYLYMRSGLTSIRTNTSLHVTLML